MPYKNSSLITVKYLSNQDSTPYVIQICSKQDTSDPLLVGKVTNSDADTKIAINLLQKYYTGSKLKLPTFTEEEVTAQKIIVVRMHNENAADVQKVSRQQVIATGDINVGINLVEKAGFDIKKPKGTVERGFDLTNAGIGAIDIDTVAPAKPKHLGYIRRGAPTTGNNVPPQDANIMEYIVSTAGKVNVADLQSQTWYAFSEAVVLPVPKASVVTSGPTPSTEKKLTPMKVTKGHRVTFSAKSTSHYAMGSLEIYFCTIIIAYIILLIL